MLRDFYPRTEKLSEPVRLVYLDYLRGLAAFGIMVFHFFTWTYGDFQSDTLIGRLGIYGVTLFFILSGITLYQVYFGKMSFTKQDVLTYGKKRILRIFPLFWLVTITDIMLSKTLPDFSKLFLNLSGLFAVFSWDKYFSTGVWAIGNELVFYACFPLFVYFTKKNKVFMTLLALVLFSWFILFTFEILNPGLTLKGQWRNYSNPLNQVFLFMCGFITAHIFNKISVPWQLNLGLLFLGLAGFVFIPASGDLIHLVTGTKRILFSGCSLLICFSFYKMTFSVPGWIHKGLTFLGEASYSIYLLHPVTWFFILFFSRVFNLNLSIPSSFFLLVVSQLTISYFVYHRFEKYFMLLGKRERNEKSH